MKIVFRKSYVCGSCNNRFASEDAAIAYRGGCICRECYNKIDRVSPKSMFEAKGNVDFVSAAFYYTDVYRRVFLNFKFSSLDVYGNIIGIALREYFSSFSELSSYDFLVPVPLSKGRRNKRGFNQSEIFAKYISQSIGVPVSCVLKRQSEEIPQSKLSAAERARNVKKAFSCSDDLNGKRVIIVDDVYTTGSTMSACADALIEAGAKSICGVVAAYVYKQERTHAPLPYVNKATNYTGKHN